MYHLLIVDDEPWILEGLYEMLVRCYGERFWVYKAGSAQEALNLCDEINIDVVMTDICMPEMDGLEMARRIQTKWQDCMVIFLTGHNEFSYAKQAVGARTIRYVLKLDGDEEIQKAVEEAYERLEEEYVKKCRVLRLEEKTEEFLPFIREECVKEMMDFFWMTPKEKQKLEKKMEMIGAENFLRKPFLMAVIHIGEENGILEEKKIETILLNCLEKAFFVLNALVTPRQILCLILAGEEDVKRTKSFLEIGVTMCERMGLNPPEICLYVHPVPLNMMASIFWKMNGEMAEFGSSMQVWLYKGETEGEKDEEEYESEIRGSFNQQRMEEIFQYGTKESGLRFLDEIQGKGNIENPQMCCMVYATLAANLLQACMRYLPEKNGFFGAVSLERLTNYEHHRNFSDAMKFIRYAVGCYFDERAKMNQDHENQMIWKLHTYIAKNIGNDLSMPHLGGKFQLNPTYLSRLYKKMMGISLNQYILSVRLQYAKKLLKNEGMKIQVIAEKTGFHTASYFTHFFKKQEGMTPQEYRMRFKEGE